MWQVTAHIACPVAQLTLSLESELERSECTNTIDELEDPRLGIETLQVAELGVDVDDEALPATMWALLAHNIDDEVAGELDESVGAGFCND